jgi:ribosomal protein L12E/L44/L45/RPP1/RPP2
VAKVIAQVPPVVEALTGLSLEGLLQRLKASAAAAPPLAAGAQAADAAAPAGTLPADVSKRPSPGLKQG